MIATDETRNAETETNVNTAAPNRWDTPTKWFAWAVLIAFTALSAYMNGAYAVLTSSLIWFHAGIPGVVLVLGVFLELTFLSSAHRAAKRIVVTGLGLSFAVVLIASYLAVLHVTGVWNPHAPQWVNAALAALPDVVMVLAATVVLSLRMRDQSQARRAPKRVTESRLRRLADAATTRAEAALSVQVNPVTEVRGGSANDATEAPAVPVAETPAEVRETGSRTPAPTRRPSPRAVAKPSVDPELEPFMDAARSMEVDGLVRGKTAEDYARIIAAVDRGWSPTRIKSEFSYSHDTTRKVVEALEQADHPAEPRVLTAV